MASGLFFLAALICGVFATSLALADMHRGVHPALTTHAALSVGENVGEPVGKPGPLPGTPLVGGAVALSVSPLDGLPVAPVVGVSVASLSGVPVAPVAGVPVASLIGALVGFACDELRPARVPHVQLTSDDVRPSTAPSRFSRSAAFHWNVASFILPALAVALPQSFRRTSPDQASQTLPGHRGPIFYALPPPTA